MPKSVNLSKAHAIHAIQVYHALKVTVSSDISISRIGDRTMLNIWYTLHCWQKNPKNKQKFASGRIKNGNYGNPPSKPFILYSKIGEF